MNQSYTGAFLSGDDLRNLIEKDKAVYCVKEDSHGNTEKEPFVLDSNGKWSDWSLDLSLGKEVYLSSEEAVQILNKRESVTIKPGEFALLMTEERVNIPDDNVAFISMKFGQKLKGLINISGFHVDPNFHGHIIFSVYNAGPSPAILRRGDPVFMIVFSTLTQSLPKDSRKGSDFPEILGLKTKWLSGIQGRTTSLETVGSELRNVQNRVELHDAILVAVIATLLGLILAQAIS